MTIATTRTDEVVVPGKGIVPGMVIATDHHSREPREIYLVTEVTKTGTIKGSYLGNDKTRCRESQHVVGTAHSVLLYPNAVVALHGLPK